MCGINGILSKQALGPESEASLLKMNRALSHRGPDFAGTFSDHHALLGHTLLSIRDRADASHQPYGGENSPWILLFNGQIYNTKEIKKNLPSSFAEEVLDTALLFGLIKQYGWEFQKYIHGMFAIALYHKKEEQLSLYRDPSGQKPIYFSEYDGSFFFSSEIKALLKNSEISRKVDEEGLAIACALGYIPGEKTLFKEIQKVRPGECVTFDTKTGKISRSLYHVGAEYYQEASPEEVLRALIEEHLQSREKIILNLSGGLDSSLLLHEASALGYSFDTYSTSFEGSDEHFNEDAILAKHLASDYGTRHHEIQITKASYESLFHDAYSIVEEPDYNISLPIYLETAKAEGRNGDGNRVVLSGNGGDEVFGGYSFYSQSVGLMKKRRLFMPVLFDFLKNFRNGTSLDFGNATDRWYFFKRFLWSALKKNPDFSVSEYLKQNSNDFPSLYKKKNGDAYDMMFLDRLLWMSSENFLQTDKLYMSESLEMRSPLSYQPFREYFDAKLSENDYTSGEGNKIYLRKLYRRKLPDYIVNRKKKTGWRAPIEKWYDHTTKNLFLDIIQNAKQGSLIDWKKVSEKIETTDKWPGKYIHLYLSFAILSKEFGLEL